ncbi:MAG: MucBP domain-containing protein, partial [Defluviitaleaceae bacterium]|nr:MucBP domain-containing protein [Defluviitaleaceae bacterium]
MKKPLSIVARIVMAFVMLVVAIGAPITPRVFADQVGPPFPSNLQNQSFEEVIGLVTTKANFVAQDVFPGWVTSDSQGAFEVWPSGLTPGGDTMSFDAAPGNGNWFIELNANDGPGSYIYQDLTTIPGALYQWSFYHRGRNGQDVAMMFLGDPTNGDLTTADAQPAADGTDAPSGITNPDGPTFLIGIRAAWQQHMGYYQPATDTTRFQLYSYSSVAGTGTGGGNQLAEGNLVDATAWTMIAAPFVVTVQSGAPVDPNVVGRVFTQGGFQGQFAQNYDFVTPGSNPDVVVDVYDDNGNLVGSVTSTVNVYAALTVQYVNQDGTEISPADSPIFYPATFGNNDPADFTAAGAFDYTAPTPPPTIVFDGITYEYRSLSTAADPSGLSAPQSGTLTGNATVIYVYEPRQNTLTVQFVDDTGVTLQAPSTTTIGDGATYRVTADGGSGDITFPLGITVGLAHYSFVEISPAGDPSTGTMDG